LGLERAKVWHGVGAKGLWGCGEGAIKPIPAEEIGEDPCCSGNREGLGEFTPMHMIAGIGKEQRNPDD